MARKKFAKLVAGKAPSMMNHDVANEVIDSCAAFESLLVVPTGSGKLHVSGRTATLELQGALASGDLDLVLCVDGELHSITVVGTDNGVIT